MNYTLLCFYNIYGRTSFAFLTEIEIIWPNKSIKSLANSNLLNSLTVGIFKAVSHNGPVMDLDLEDVKTLTLLSDVGTRIISSRSCALTFSLTRRVHNFEMR